MADTQVKRLVIVESPAKAKTIQKYLGEGYVVEASVGHIRDLPQRAAEVPKEFKKNKWASLGIDIESDFEPLYVVDSAKQSRVNDLKKEWSLMKLQKRQFKKQQITPETLIKT